MLDIVLSSPATYVILAGQVFLIVFSAVAAPVPPSAAGKWLENPTDAPVGPNAEWRRKWGKALLPTATRARLG